MSSWFTWRRIRRKKFPLSSQHYDWTSIIDLNLVKHVLLSKYVAYRYVGDKSMLDVGDFFKLKFENLSHQIWVFTLCKESVTTISKFSTTDFVSNIRHQHRCSRLLAIENDSNFEPQNYEMITWFEIIRLFQNIRYVKYWKLVFYVIS